MALCALSLLILSLSLPHLLSPFFSQNHHHPHFTQLVCLMLACFVLCVRSLCVSGFKSVYRFKCLRCFGFLRPRPVSPLPPPCLPRPSRPLGCACLSFLFASLLYFLIYLSFIYLQSSCMHQGFCLGWLGLACFLSYFGWLINDPINASK